MISKALESYIGSLYSDGWSDAQADTQFQGTGSGHELAALLLTESINHSLYVLKKPYFILLLDAKSVFDLIPKESVIVNAFKAGTQDQGLLYLNNRLGNRQTFCEWSNSLMADARLSMIEMIQAFLVPRQHLFPVIKEYWSQDNEMKMQFLLDCSNLPLVIGLAQAYTDKSVIKDLFYVTRTYVAKVFMTRRRLLPLK